MCLPGTAACEPRQAWEKSVFPRLRFVDSRSMAVSYPEPAEGGLPRMQYVLIVVAAVLLLNFLAAAVAVLRRAQGGSWLLILLLSSTTGAALAVLIGMLSAELGGRSVDVALVFAGLAAISAAVVIAAFPGMAERRPPGQGADDAV